VKNIQIRSHPEFILSIFVLRYNLLRKSLPAVAKAMADRQDERPSIQFYPEPVEGQDERTLRYALCATQDVVYPELDEGAGTAG